LNTKAEIFGGQFKRTRRGLAPRFFASIRRKSVRKKDADLVKAKTKRRSDKQKMSKVYLAVAN
jgi:hypothetical protein